MTSVETSIYEIEREVSRLRQQLLSLRVENDTLTDLLLRALEVVEGEGCTKLAQEIIDATGCTGGMKDRREVVE